MSIKSSPTRPGTIAGKEIKRPAEKKYWVKSPDGAEVIEINQSNAFDLVNHNGWSFHKPKAEAPAAEEAPKADAAVEAKAPEEKKDEEPAKEPSVIDKLRAEATALGIPVDARWGVRTLTEKIDEAKDAAEEAAAEAAAAAESDAA